MATASEPRPRIRAEVDARLRDRSQADRRLLIVGILNKHLPAKSPAVLVGGAAVEFYTKGGHVTGDVDLVGDRALVRGLLIPAGFREEGRYFLREDLGLVVEVPGSSLRPTETPIEIEFEGYVIPVVAVEDSIVDRLLAAKYWKSETDWEQAILLYATHRKRIDPKALERKARGNEVEDSLGELERLVEGAGAGSARDSRPGRRPRRT